MAPKPPAKAPAPPPAKRAAAPDPDHISAEEASLAIDRAAAKRPQIAVAREKLSKLAGDDERGLRMLAEAIRRMMRES
ncbi:hypothetical protein HL658_35495 [Azospirillum sp. RWY-5-1]|uniref:Uncharacterized protein n=1 Tax=Azospirillum oleiclasticum TaxID=2735135 RepID=A0ABX2TN14_9PROT|nr:hypothetical protein [Azospirillum oleiclasticum]NYZ17876.1 hypothetical protein [Azospirillum oleiclasticum]NYZ25084.1 hypothetical protein [Azospirillum oleiclasticum]